MPLTIGSVDDAGTHKTFPRTDSANIGGVDRAVDKAVAAASFPFSTRALQQGLESTP